MQKFTRALTREVELAGERLAVTLSEEGITLRPVGSRRPPHSLSWAAVVCTSAGHPPTGGVPTAEELQAAVKALKAGAEKPADKAKKEPEAPAEFHPAPAHAAHPAEHAPPPAPPAPSASRTTAAPAQFAVPLHPPATSQSVPALLERIDHWLSAHRPRFHKGLLPGATDADLQPLREALGGKVPADLEALLRWHNGQDPDVFGGLEGDWHPLSAREIADAKKELDAAPPPGWARSEVPFLADDTGASYTALDADKPGRPVRAFWQGNPHPEEVAPTLAGWLGDFATALEAGQYHEDPERGTFHKAK